MLGQAPKRRLGTYPHLIAIGHSNVTQRMLNYLDYLANDMICLGIERAFGLDHATTVTSKRFIVSAESLQIVA